MYFSYQWYVLNIFKNFKYAKALTERPSLNHLISLTI